MSLNLHVVALVESVFLMWSLLEEGAQGACVRTIIIGGLDIVVDMRNALSEHLIVVVSTNIVRHTLHEAGLRSLEKCRKSFAHCQECALQVGLCSTSSRLDYA
jgi:hypothetical protein